MLKLQCHVCRRNYDAGDSHRCPPGLLERYDEREEERYRKRTEEEAERTFADRLEEAELLTSDDDDE